MKQNQGKIKKYFSSWRVRMVFILLLVFFATTTLQVLSLTHYVNTIRTKAVRESQNALTVWTASLDQRLDGVSEHMLEVLATLQDNTQLKKGSPEMNWKAKNSIKELMDNKLVNNDNVSCMFLSDTDSGSFLFSVKQKNGSSEVNRLKALCTECAVENAEAIDEKTWKMLSYGGSIYAMRSIHLGKYVIASVVSMGHSDVTGMTSVLGDDFVLFTFQNSTPYVLGGGGDEEAIVQTGEDGKPEFQDRITYVEGYSERLESPVYLAAEIGALSDRAGWSSAALMLTGSLICIILFIFLWVTMYRMIMKPSRILINANAEVGSGNLGYQIGESMNSSEFQELKASFNDMSREIQELKIDSYDRALREQEDKLQLLRAQIRPHFYLNAITTISNMAYQDRTEDIQIYCQAFSKYVRYMLSVKSSFTTVGQELTHIENYIQLQKIRFPGSVSLDVSCDEALREIQLPMLMMFTVVENSFKHAADLYNTLELKISCETNEDGNLEILISDNGPGFPEDVLQDEKDLDAVLQAKDHLGLSNVKYTMALTYGMPNLLTLFNLPEGGAAVKIIIPEKGAKDEAADL